MIFRKETEFKKAGRLVFMFIAPWLLVLKIGFSNNSCRKMNQGGFSSHNQMKKIDRKSVLFLFLFFEVLLRRAESDSATFVQRNVAQRWKKKNDALGK